MGPTSIISTLTVKTELRPPLNLWYLEREQARTHNTIVKQQTGFVFFDSNKLKGCEL
jgi:hypothetical protein